MPDRTAAAVFFDRDGTVMEDVNYCSDPEAVRVFRGVTESLQSLKSTGFKLIMVTNQSGIGRGYFTTDQYNAVHAEVLRQLGANLVDATYYCPDPPGIDSQCRKPAPGMILQGAKEHRVDLTRSVMIGDKEIDIHCGHNGGIKAIRVRTGFEKNTADSSADWIAEDFAEATKIVLQHFVR